MSPQHPPSDLWTPSATFVGSGTPPYTHFSLNCTPPYRTSQDPLGLSWQHTRHHCGCCWEQVTPGCPYFWGPCSHCGLAEVCNTGTVVSPPSVFLPVQWVGGTGWVLRFAPYVHPDGVSSTLWEQRSPTGQKTEHDGKES